MYLYYYLLITSFHVHLFTYTLSHNMHAPLFNHTFVMTFRCSSSEYKTCQIHRQICYLTLNHCLHTPITITKGMKSPALITQRFLNSFVFYIIRHVTITSLSYPHHPSSVRNCINIKQYRLSLQTPQLYLQDAVAYSCVLT